MTDSKTSPDLEFSIEQTQPDEMASAYAERLMDELFNGVERALEGDVEALNTVSEPEILDAAPASELTLSFTEGGLPAVLLDNAAESDLTPLSSALTTVAEPSPSPDPPTNTQKSWKDFWTLNRALLGAAGLSVLATLALWFHQRQQVPITTTVPAPTPADSLAVNPDAEFLQYLERSLDVIAQNAPAATSTATTDVSDVAIALNNGAVGLPPIGNNALPTPPPNGVPAGPPGSINVIERVYVPYPSAQAPATYPTTQGSPAPAGSEVSGTGAVAAATSTPHTLLGVLELGDRSAALFEIDGVPQRVYIGERVGSSDWSLVSVANEEAVIRRNGEVRSLYIGQRF
ncbi:hypothetical protein PN498_23335 [Oscillatoria sp. CS-180]|uniref:hypothetical protein n=1 Tax=Oscillatoria sp. CS-180 TaxID=3021720 RepID=UPI00232E354F|nr:hypothetical protein [Oscillatoria sp. CS-180]MDB9528946.1 hypothetical protein [Oscillatoria sp. CS-180]